MQNFEEGNIVKFIKVEEDFDNPRYFGIIIEKAYQYPEYRYKILWFDETFDSTMLSYHEGWMQDCVKNLTDKLSS